jgi:hypothetical protein
MDTSLTILKFAGLAASTLLGVLQIITKTHEEVNVPVIVYRPGQPEWITVRRLNRWGKVSLILLLVSFAVALGAQMLESVKNYRESRAAQARIEEQLALSKKTLLRIQRLLTRFDEFKIEATYRLDYANSGLEPLHVLACEIAKELPPETLSVVGPTREIKKVGGITIVDITTAPVGFIESSLLGDVAVITIQDQEIEIRFSLPSVSRLISNAVFQATNRGEMGKVISFLEAPDLNCAIYAAPQFPMSEDPDFAAHGHSPVPRPELVYKVKSSQLFIKWQFDFPKSTWVQSKRLASLPDLGRAILFLSIMNVPSNLASNVCPIDTQLAFDFMNVTVGHFSKLDVESTVDFGGFVWFGSGIPLHHLGFGKKKFPVQPLNLFWARLPSEEDIMKPYD